MDQLDKRVQWVVIMKAFESLKGMLCDPDGTVCIQGTDEDRAEIQRHLNDAGRMVDMNNSLIVDNNYLRAKVASIAAAEIDLLRADKHNLYRSWSELRQQLAESQAREQGLREALSELIDLVGDMVSGEYKYDSFTLQPAREALSQPTDSTALQEWGVKN